MRTDEKPTVDIATRPGGETPSLTGQAYKHWCEFWFEPQETSTLAIIRILFGLVALAWTLTLLPDLRPFFTSEGVLPSQPSFGLPGQWGLFSISSSYTFVFIVFVAVVIAAICLTLGIGTRLACIVVWLGILAFTRRNPYVANSGDLYVRVVAFYLILTPAAASLSLRRWLRERDRFWEFPRRSVWGLRLIQMQVSIVYVTAFWDKVSTGPLWNNGTALSYVLRIQDLTRFPTPTFPTNSLPINLQDLWDARDRAFPRGADLEQASAALRGGPRCALASGDRIHAPGRLLFDGRDHRAAVLRRARRKRKSDPRGSRPGSPKAPASIVIGPRRLAP